MTPAVSEAQSRHTAEAFWNILWNPGLNVWSGSDCSFTFLFSANWAYSKIFQQNCPFSKWRRFFFFLMIKANASCSNWATLAADCEASGPNFFSFPINKLDLIVCLYVRSCLAAEGQKPTVITRLIYSQKTCCTINRRRVVRDENISKLFEIIYSAPRSEFDVKTHHWQGERKCFKEKCDHYLSISQQPAFSLPNKVIPCVMWQLRQKGILKIYSLG